MLFTFINRLPKFHNDKPALNLIAVSQKKLSGHFRYPEGLGGNLLMSSYICEFPISKDSDLTDKVKSFCIYFQPGG